MSSNLSEIDFQRMTGHFVTNVRRDESLKAKIEDGAVGAMFGVLWSVGTVKGGELLLSKIYSENLPPFPNSIIALGAVAFGAFVYNEFRYAPTRVCFDK